jgi:GNAT superfamily N-acetyltransferase
MARIRPATELDISKIRELYQAWEAEKITYGLRADEEADVRQKLGDFSFVVEVEDEVVGFVLAHRRISEGLAVIPAHSAYLEIEDLFVRRRHRRRRFGGELVSAVLERARRDGVEYAHVFTATKETHRILHFYEEGGFHCWGMQMFQRLAPDT